MRLYVSFLVGFVVREIEVWWEAFQEALIRQVNDLKELLGDDWGWVGVGRDDGVERGEFSPIFYKK